MRNIINHKDISVFLENLEIRKPDCKAYIYSHIRNYLYRYADVITKKNHENVNLNFKNNDFFDSVILNEELENNVVHCLDYWIHHCNKNLNIPYNELERQSAENDKKLISKKNVDAGTTFAVDSNFDENKSLVRLYDKKSFISEGVLLSHCVGDYYKFYGEFDDHYLGDRIHGIFSYRDSDNKPLFTMEIQSGVIYQIKGYANCDIDISLYPRLQEWIQNENLLNISDRLRDYSWEFEARDESQFYTMSTIILINLIAIISFVGYYLLN